VEEEDACYVRQNEDVTSMGEICNHQQNMGWWQCQLERVVVI